MESARKAELFRSYMKEELSKKGLKFNQEDFKLRKVAEEAKRFSKKMKLATPMTAAELIELYLELGQELTAEHFRMVERKLAKAIRRQIHKEPCPSTKPARPSK